MLGPIEVLGKVVVGLLVWRLIPVAESQVVPLKGGCVPRTPEIKTFG